MIRYKRAPSEDFCSLFAPGKLLAPLVEPRSVHGLRLDLHFRENDHLHVYCGLTRILDVWLARRERIRVSAHATYTAQSDGTLFRRPWAANDPGFTDALVAYLDAVQVRPSFWQREGAVQAAWSAVGDPWVPFDREVVIGHDNLAEQASGRTFESVRQAWAELDAKRGAGRPAATMDRVIPAELDQLAVDHEGRLVLIELKDGAAAGSSVYNAPLQLLQYLHVWAAAFDQVKEDLLELLRARKSVGLSPPGTPQLVSGLRPVVAFGDPGPSERTLESLFDSLSVANRHLPPPAEPMEVWVIKAGSPLRIY